MLPVWGTAAVLVAPPAPLFTTGYVAGNTLPAQYWNYLFFHLTKELNNVLTAAGVAQSGSVDTQLLQSIRALQRQIVSTSGALGTLTVVNDTDYILTAASTATLPAVPDHPGLRLTFNAKTNATSTFTANAGQTIGIGGTSTYTIFGAGSAVTLEWDGVSNWKIVFFSRSTMSTSGALGTIAVNNDATIFFTAATTVTLPTNCEPGTCLTFKAKTTATSTISATIGTTGSTSFVLYAQEDYVTLEWDGASIWYVVVTNGPVQQSNQTAQTTLNNSSAWTAIGNGLSLGTLAPGIYDLEIDCTIGGVTASENISIALGNGTTPISPIVNAQFSSGSLAVVPAHVGVKGYVLAASATIQGIYYSSSASQAIEYNATTMVGRISARRIG